MHKVDFGNSDIAQRFFPVSDSKVIVVDPERQFGQPIINGTSIKAETLYNLYKGGEKKEYIAELYGIKPVEVQQAIQYFKNVA